MPSGQVRLGIVGCGDVLYRSYFPGLEKIANLARVAAYCDSEIARAERAAAYSDWWSPDARTYADLGAFLQHAELEGVLNLTPAPRHYDVNAAALAAGLHVWSEKPLAADVDGATRLIREAGQAGRLLLCAPAIMATSRFRWLKQVIEAGRIGRPTLATAQFANLGPAAWRVYTGDPATYYQSSVGPLLDQGVYLLHAITGLLGPARRVQAFGGLALPQRTIVAGARAGQTINVEANDHMLLHLDFGENTFAQLLSSFAVAATRVPALEVHGTSGSFSLHDPQSAHGAVDAFVLDDGPLGWEGWISGITPTLKPVPVDDLIALGPMHFVACLRGAETPILTPEHARHVLEIANAATRSIQEGRAEELQTTFGQAPRLDQAA